MLIVVAATLSVAATDLFHIEDFMMQPGQTVEVEILLDNETSFTAFQTDLSLPEGLSVDMQSVALTGRKAEDHVLATNVLSNGDIRIMSYSMMIQPYSGNSGALVTFNVTASESLSGPVVIRLKNNRFTNLQGREVQLDDTSCTVLVPSLVGDVNGSGDVTIADVTKLINYLLSKDPSACHLENADLNGSGDVTIADVTMLINRLLRGEFAN